MCPSEIALPRAAFCIGVRPCRKPLIVVEIAFAVAAFLQEMFDFSRLTAVPCGLWLAVRINNHFLAPRYNAPAAPQTG